MMRSGEKLPSISSVLLWFTLATFLVVVDRLDLATGMLNNISWLRVF